MTVMTVLTRKEEKMATNILSRKQTKYITVKQFKEKYNISHGHATNIIHSEGFPMKYIGKTIRIDEEGAEEFIQKTYNQ